MIVDAHAHISPTKTTIPKKYHDAILAYRLTAGIEVTHYGTTEDLIEGIEKNGIAKAWLLPLSVSKSLEKVSKINNFIAAAVREHPNFEGFAVANPSLDNASEELDRAVREEGLKGLVIDPNKYRFNFSSDDFWRLLETAKTLEIPVFVHLEYLEENRHFNAEEVNEAVLSFPTTKFIFAYLGKQDKDTPSKIYPEPNVFYETSHASPEEIEAAVKAYGAEKILFGSDFKYNFYPQYEIKKIRNLNISEAEKEKILGGNAVKILKTHFEKKRAGFLGRIPFLNRFRLTS